MIEYSLVSEAACLRDYYDEEIKYINEEHKMLVNIADSMFNLGYKLTLEHTIHHEYLKLIEKYGCKYFQEVIGDMACIDSQLSFNNSADLLIQYTYKIHA